MKTFLFIAAVLIVLASLFFLYAEPAPQGIDMGSIGARAASLHS